MEKIENNNRNIYNQNQNNINNINLDIDFINLNINNILNVNGEIISPFINTNNIIFSGNDTISIGIDNNKELFFDNNIKLGLLNENPFILFGNSANQMFKINTVIDDNNYLIDNIEFKLNTNNKKESNIFSYLFCIDDDIILSISRTGLELNNNENSYDIQFNEEELLNYINTDSYTQFINDKKILNISNESDNIVTDFYSNSFNFYADNYMISSFDKDKISFNNICEFPVIKYLPKEIIINDNKIIDIDVKSSYQILKISLNIEVSSLPEGKNGQVLMLQNQNIDNNQNFEITFTNNNNIILATDKIIKKNEFIQFIYNNSSWYFMFKS